MSIARYYDESKNPDGAVLDGVPLRDLTVEEFETLPPWLQANVDASPMYRKTKPRHPSDPEPSGEGDQVDPGDGVEKTATLAAADGTPAELTTTTTRRRRE